jgi:release factor glutamine methyltransferase
VYWQDLNLPYTYISELQLLSEQVNAGYPLDYAVGQVTIPELNLTLKLTRETLIPRPETIEWIKTCVLESWIPEDNSIIEIGTGSGLIGIFLANNSYYTIATDISDPALKVAKLNHSLNIQSLVDEKSSHINFIKSDVLEYFLANQEFLPSRPWTLIANLPYVPDSDKLLNSYQTIKYEPQIALFSGQDGLNTVRKLTKELELLETPPQQIILELDPRNIRIAAELFGDHWDKTFVLDWQGYERVLMLNHR